MEKSEAIAVSIIVPVYRQWFMLDDFVAALQAQRPSLGPDVELILVNNGPVADVPLKALPLGWRIVHATQPGSYAARNAGASAANGDLLVFTDADCRPDRDWLSSHRVAHKLNPHELLAGEIRMFDLVPPNLWSRYDKVRGIPQSAYVARGYGVTANLAIKATIFHALGGFNTEYFSGEDARFCKRAGRQGYPIRLVKNATVGHPCRASAQEVVTKARRVLGGHVPASSQQRFLWLLRAALPPFLTSVSLVKRRHPLRDRLSAVIVAWILWVVEIREALRLVRGAGAERE